MQETYEDQKTNHRVSLLEIMAGMCIIAPGTAAEKALALFHMFKANLKRMVMHAQPRISRCTRASTRLIKVRVSLNSSRRRSRAGCPPRARWGHSGRGARTKT